MKNRLLAALQEIDRRLRQDPAVLAATVFGSLENGDIWEHSDLDIIAVLKAESEVVDAVYLELSGVRVHIQIISKPSLASRIQAIGGGPFNNAFHSGKILFCRDPQIREWYDSIQTLSPEDIKLRITEALGNLLSQIYTAEKCLCFSKVWDAQRSLLAALSELAKIRVYEAGGYPQRDLLDNSPPDIRKALGLLESAESEDEGTQLALRHLRRLVKENLAIWGRDIIEFLQQEETSFSSTALEEHPRYKRLRTDLDRLLDELVRHNLLKIVLRSYSLPGSETPVGEEVTYTV